MILFLKKLLYEELFETSFPIKKKKGYIHFRRQMAPSLQEGLGPQKQFFAIFSENTVFFFFGKPVKLSNIQSLPYDE